MKLTVQVHNDEDGGFWAHVQEIPGCITLGDTVEELEANLQEVIELCLEGIIEDHVESITGDIELEPGDSTWAFELKPRREKSRART